ITMTSSQYRTLKLRIYSLALKNNRSGLPLWSGVNTLKRTLWWHVTGLERVAQDLRSLYRSRLTRATVYWCTAVGYPWARRPLPQRPFLRRVTDRRKLLCGRTPERYQWIAVPRRAKLLPFVWQALVINWATTSLMMPTG